MSTRFSTFAAVLIVLTAAIAACGGDGSRAEAGPASGPGSGGAAAAPGRMMPPTVLSASDVATVGVADLEAGIPITGDLRPVEVVEVRSRIEGDLVSVLVREGDRVGRGQLLARFEGSEQESNLRSAQAEQAAARSDLETARWNAEQSAELFQAGAISEQAQRAARQEEVAAVARLAAADARVGSTGFVVRDTRVLSPTTGIVEQRHVESGERVAPGQQMFTVVRNDVLELSASVPARDANEVRANQRAYFAAAGRSLEGTVARVSPTIDPATRAITVYVRIANPDGALKGNTFASGRIVGRTVNGALVVPSAALRQSQQAGESFVYRLNGDVIERVPVQIGINDDARQLTQILSGLRADDRIIVGNVGALGAGSRVQIVGGEDVQ